MKNKRNSSYELMRIISMFLIIIYHIIVHGKVIENCNNEGLKIIFEIVLFMTLVHVNSFVLVTGYYQIDSSFKQKKIWALLNASWFYRLIIMGILLCIDIISIDKLTIIREGFPININEYWFLKNYIILYCISPFINKALINFDKKTFKSLLIVLFIILSIIPAITGGLFFDNNGLTLYQFIYMYMIGAYLKKYPLNKSYLFKRASNNKYKIYMISIFLICVFLNYTLYKYSDSLLNVNTITEDIGRNIHRTGLLYSNPYVIIQSVAFFLYIGAHTINSSIINKLASLSFGIYLIHDNNFMRDLLYKWLKIDNGNIYSYKFFVYVLTVSIIIFIVCAIIEFLRQLLFKFIYNLKLSKKIREKYYNYISQI